MGLTQKAAWARGQLPCGTKPGLLSLASFSVVTVALTQHLPSCTLIQAFTLTGTCNQCSDPQGGYPELCRSVLLHLEDIFLPVSSLGSANSSVSRAQHNWLSLLGQDKVAPPTPAATIYLFMCL